MDLTAFGQGAGGGTSTAEPARPAPAVEHKARPAVPQAAPRPEPTPPAPANKSERPRKGGDSASPAEVRETPAPAGAHGPSGGQGTGSGREGYGPGQVDRPPRLLRRIDPRYPEAARRQGVHGKVVLKFLVGADGRVRDIEVVEAEPPGAFEQAAVEAVSRWEFSPAMLRGRPVAVWMRVPVSFRLR
nr:energy transducer TonB [Desulfovibrio aminophilus]